MICQTLFSSFICIFLNLRSRKTNLQNNSGNTKAGWVLHWTEETGCTGRLDLCWSWSPELQKDPGKWQNERYKSRSSVDVCIIKKNKLMLRQWLDNVFVYILRKLYRCLKSNYKNCRLIKRWGSADEHIKRGHFNVSQMLNHYRDCDGWTCSIQLLILCVKNQ